MKNYILTCLLLAGAASAAPAWDDRWLGIYAHLRRYALLTESNPSVGADVDLIGALGGPVDFALAPLASGWQLDFDKTLGLGVGSYTFNGNATIGAVNSGTLQVIVEAYSDGPIVCGGVFVVETLSFDVPFSVTSAVPEEGTFLMVGGVLLWLKRSRLVL